MQHFSQFFASSNDSGGVGSAAKAKQSGKCSIKNSNVLTSSNLNAMSISGSTRYLNNNNNNSNLNALSFSSGDEFSLPVLSAKRKPFWISHLKLAESREIELNKYVQQLFKLPIKISHSPLVLKFFESQASDPKPSAFARARQQEYYNNNNNNNNNSNNNTNTTESSIELGSDSNEEYREYDLEENFGDNNLTTILHYNNLTINNNNSNGDFLTNKNNDILLEKDNEDDNDDEEEEGEADEDDDDNEDDIYDDYEESTTYYDHLENNSSKRIKQINSNSFSFKKGSTSRNKKRSDKEAGLWWDEDIALNELTSSMSFDFDSQYNNQLQSPNVGMTMTAKPQKNTLEPIIGQNNELETSKVKIISSSTSATTSMTSANNVNKSENLIRRLSMS
jgi:hypothetical protein